MSVRPVKLLPVRDRVAAALREAILSRSYQEGDTLALDELSGKLGVSVTPIREALQLLSSDGLIKLRPNKGAIVLGINQKYVEEHFELRSILESEMVYKVCSHPEIDISEIVAIHNQSVSDLNKGDISAYSNANQAFHMAIWKAAGNERIFNHLKGMWNGLSIGASTTELEYVKLSISEHTSLVNAIQNRDAELAKALMKSHIVRSKQDMLTNII